MIKRTLYFGSPAYLKTTNEQLVFESTETGEVKSSPIEDIGVVILDHQQITVSQSLISKLLANNVAFITCDQSHHPTGLLLNLDGNTLQSLKFQAQLEASVPLQKQLWQQTVSSKLTNQAAVLETVKNAGQKTCAIGLQRLKVGIAKITKPERLLIIGNTFSPISWNFAGKDMGLRLIIY